MFEDVNSQPKPHYKTVPVQLIVGKKKKKIIFLAVIIYRIKSFFKY